MKWKHLFFNHFVHWMWLLLLLLRFVGFVDCFGYHCYLSGCVGKQFKLELWYKSFRWYKSVKQSTARIPKKQQKWRNCSCVLNGTWIYDIIVWYTKQQTQVKCMVLVATRVGVGGFGWRGCGVWERKGKHYIVLTTRQHCYQYDSTRPNVRGLCMIWLD